MVGLTDQNLQLNARIRVGQDFGLIKYLGEVSHQVKKNVKIFLKTLLIRSRDMKEDGLGLNGMILLEADIMEQSKETFISKQGEL